MSNPKDNSRTVLPQNFEALVFRRSLVAVLSFLLLLWIVKLVEVGMDASFAQYGILPRTWEGIKGILFSPLIHGDFYHLISNSIPLAVLGIGLFYFYTRIAPEVTLWIYLATGFWVWIDARGESYHIGASGLVYGLAAFLIVGGFLRRNLRVMTTSLVVLFLYGGMFYGVLPGEAGISWESHALGAVSGGVLAVFFRKEPIWTIPNPPELEKQEEVASEEETIIPPTDPIVFPYKFVPEQEED
ncbi:MAG: rhomboid family intramembrane serine protease [Bacteroidota bacterium]